MRRLIGISFFRMWSDAGRKGCGYDDMDDGGLGNTVVYLDEYISMDSQHHSCQYGT